jgi:hypothetical protein
MQGFFAKIKCHMSASNYSVPSIWLVLVKNRLAVCDIVCTKNTSSVTDLSALQVQ